MSYLHKRRESLKESGQNGFDEGVSLAVFTLTLKVASNFS